MSSRVDDSGTGSGGEGGRDPFSASTAEAANRASDSDLPDPDRDCLLVSPTSALDGSQGVQRRRSHQLPLP